MTDVVEEAQAIAGGGPLAGAGQRVGRTWAALAPEERALVHGALVLQQVRAVQGTWVESQLPFELPLIADLAALALEHSPGSARAAAWRHLRRVLLSRDPLVETTRAFEQGVAAEWDAR